MTTAPESLRLIDALKRAIVQYTDRHANEHGLATAPIPGLHMKCVRRPGTPTRVIYKPLVCLVLQGAKQITIGAEMHSFSAGQCFVVGFDVPAAGQIVQATRETPFIELVVELDIAAIRELTIALEPSAAAHVSNPPLFVVNADEAVLDCGMRLMQLIDRPAAAPLLRAGIVMELHYWLLSGLHGPALRRLVLPDGQPQRIAAAVKLLRTEFRTAIRVERLATAAGMSVTSFYRHFKALTSLTPVQFQKQLRLHEARRSMLANGGTVRQAAFEVGYESVSQFTRDYARLFGAPPRRDIRPGRTVTQDPA
jgi:AraC-like DNA-binding protein